MLDRPSLPSPKDWAIIVARNLVQQGKTISQAIGSTPNDTIEAQRHESRVIAEMRRLGSPEK